MIEFYVFIEEQVLTSCPLLLNLAIYVRELLEL